MFLCFLSVAAMLLLIVTLGRLGPNWACLAVGLAATVHCVASLLVVQQTDGVSARDFATGVLRPVAACVPMFAAVVGLRHALRHLGVGATWTSLFIEVLLGGAVYVAAAALVARPIVNDVLKLLRDAMKQRANPDAELAGPTAAM
jgi:PST family polysaccharide transporter